MKRFLIACIFTTFILASCRTYESKHDYFNGTVLVEYFQTRSRSSDDSITLTFNDKGTYDVEFSYTEGYENNRFNQGSATLPENFSITVSDGPKSKVVSQYILPGFLTVTITYNDKTESHDFK